VRRSVLWLIAVMPWVAWSARHVSADAPPDQHPGAAIGQEVQVIDLDYPAHRVIILISGKPYGVITIPDGSGGPQVPPPGPVPPTKPDPGGVEPGPGEPQPPQPPVIGQPGEVDSPDDPALAPDLKRLRDVARVYAGATAYAMRSVADAVRDGKITTRDAVLKELDVRRKERGKPLADALTSVLADATQGGTIKDRQAVYRALHFIARTIEEAGK
jgi:hypothetical protein